MKKIIFLALKIFISIALLFFLFRKADMGNVWMIMRSINFPILAAVALLYAVSQVVSTYRWSLFLPHAGIDMPFLRLISLYYVGMFFNIFLPTAIGGDVVKSYYLYKFSGKGGNSLASVFLDRFTGFFALVTIAFVSLIFGYNYVKDTYVSISMIPISLSGLGLREGAFVYLFTKVGTTDAQALSISLAGFAVMVMLGLIGGIEYMRLGSVKEKLEV